MLLGGLFSQCKGCGFFGGPLSGFSFDRGLARPGELVFGVRQRQLCFGDFSLGQPGSLLGGSGGLSCLLAPSLGQLGLRFGRL
jgi:hypothetical protein